jgi:hypothetical protein
VIRVIIASSPRTSEAKNMEVCHDYEGSDNPVQVLSSVEPQTEDHLSGIMINHNNLLRNIIFVTGLSKIYIAYF